MKSSIIVIIACDKLCSDFCHLKQIEYAHGKKIDYVDLYACGAENRESIAAFIDTLLDKYEYTPAHKENIKNFLKFLRNAEIPPISEDFIISIARQMHQIKLDSWKYMTSLMSNNRYLVLSAAEDEGFILPHDIEDINFILKALKPPYQL